MIKYMFIHSINILPARHDSRDEGYKTDQIPALWDLHSS